MGFGNWRDRAACICTDTELYFPVGTTGPAMEQVEQAKTVCRQCPVVTECLDWALASSQHDGIWGGCTEDERRTLRRARQRAGTRYLKTES